MIHTIEDLENATKEEIEEALEFVTIEDDLKKYLKWLNSAEGDQTPVQFKVGWNKHRAASLGFHPSQTAKKNACNLKMYFDVTGEVPPKPKLTPDLIMTFDIGTAAHSLLQTHLLHMYEDQFEEEVWLSDKRILIHSTHTDGRFQFSKTRFLLEIKTIKEGGNYGWEKVQTKPFEDNVRQVMTYMYLDNCPFGLVFYVCKNNGRFKEHPIVWDRKIWEEVKTDNMLPTLRALKKKRRPIASPGWGCQSCDYLHGCQDGKDYRNGKRSRGSQNSRRGRHILGGGRRSR